MEPSDADRNLVAISGFESGQDMLPLSTSHQTSAGLFLNGWMCIFMIGMLA